VADKKRRVYDLKSFSKELEDKMDFFVKYRFHIFINADKRFDEKTETIDSAWIKCKIRFEDLNIFVKNLDSNEKLESVGLTGPEMDFKLILVEDSLLALEKVDPPELDPHLPETDSLFRRSANKIKKHWEKFFELSDVILGSLASIDAPGAHGISEVKTAIEKTLKWSRSRHTKSKETRRLRKLKL